MPPELLDRLAAVLPPPRIHWHRYFGVLAPNSPLRTAVTAHALAAATTSPPAPNPEPAAELAHRRAARYAWARLLARIYEVFPLLCPLCGADMRIIAFITDASTTRDILVHLGEPTAPPRRRASHPPAARHCGTRPGAWHAPSTPTPGRQRRTSSINATLGSPHRTPRTTPGTRVPAAAAYAARSR